MEKTLYFQTDNATIASITLNLFNNEIHYTGEINEYHTATQYEIYNDLEEQLKIAMKDDTETIFRKLLNTNINDLLEKQVDNVFNYPKDELEVADHSEPLIETHLTAFHIHDAIHYMELTAEGQCYDELSDLIMDSDMLSYEQKLALQQVINTWRNTWRNYNLAKPSEHAKDILLKKFANAQRLTTSEDDADQLFEKVLEQNYQENRMEED